MSTSHWKLESKPHGVLIARYYNPEDEMNYFSATGAAELRDLIAKWEKDDAIRAIILTGGREGRFITHYSVKEIVDWTEDQEVLKANLQTPEGNSFHKMCAAFGALSKPTLVAYTGDTMGGGFELSLWSDVRIMSKSVKVGFPEVPLGILPGGTGTCTVPRLIGKSWASYMMLTATLADAEQAVRIGLVHEAVDDPVARALTLASKMAQFVPSAYALCKESINKTQDSDLPTAMKFESDNFGKTLFYDEAVQRMKDYCNTPAAQRMDWINRGGIPQ